LNEEKDEIKMHELIGEEFKSDNKENDAQVMNGGTPQDGK
jgi:hypothetical protein